MSDYNWCHGPECHKQETQSRIRGSGRDKVLRTRRIKVYQPQTPHIYDFFCNQRCLHDFLRLHVIAIANIAPRREALETPITVIKEKDTNWRGDIYTRTRIDKVDNA